MATTDSSKNSENTKSRGRGTSSKSTRKASSTRRSNAAGSNSSSRSKNASNGRGRRRSSSDYLAPYMTTTVASLIGAGVAIGLGLFATRNRWMHYAEDMNDYLHDRWERFGSDTGDHEMSDYSEIDSDDEEWSGGSARSDAAFPGSGAATNA